MNVALSRILLFAEPLDDASYLASVISAIAETSPTWDRRVRRDGTETDSAVIDLGRQFVEVCVGAPSLPAVIELQVQGLEAAGERLLDAGHGYSSTPRTGPAERLHVACGDVSVVVTTAEPTDTDHAVTAEVTGNSISVRFVSVVDASGLAIPRRVYLNGGADLAEQVDSLLRDQPLALRRRVLAAAIGVTQ